MNKRIISLVLALVMIIPSMVFGVSAENDFKVYSSLDMLNGYVTKAQVSMEEVDNYVHFGANEGAYGNNGPYINLKDDEFVLFDYPYVRFEYRTNSQSKILDTTLRHTGGESWGATHPEAKGDDQWHTVIVNMNDINLAAPIDKTEKGISLRIKPWGGGNKYLPAGSYIDIKYFACFKTQAEAEAFKYTDEFTDAAEDLYYGETGFINPDGGAKIKEIDKACDELIEKILATPTDIEVTGTKYYVSADGQDTNDGKSPATAWRTIKKVNDYKFEPGDGVFFKRGDSFRASGISLTLQSGVTYSAYGEGDKPVLMGSVNASNPLKWKETDIPNVYRFSEPVEYAGSVIIDGGRAWGICMVKSGNKCHDNGVVSNGLETFKSGGQVWDNYKTLKNNLEFLTTSGYVYLYSKDGNPGDVFDSIEISDKYSGIRGADIENVIFDNIKLFGYGGHGIGTDGVKNFSVQNCVFGWIGGTLHHSDVRLGNAVQNWGDSENFVIDNCYAYQVYDCAYTNQLTQRNGPEVFITNMKITNNVAEYCNTGLEIWNGDDSLNDTVHYKDCTLTGNYIRRSGYGWSHQRPLKDGNFYYGGFCGTTQTWDNYQVYGNFFTSASYVGVKSRHVAQKNAFFHDNTYILNRGKLFMNTVEDPVNEAGYANDFPYNDYTVEKLVNLGIEPGSDFYFLDKDYTPEEFNYKRVNDIYPDGQFADTQGHWAESYIDFTVSRGLYNGVEPGKFAPDLNMTRAMFVTVLARYDNATLEAGAKWYDGAVKWAVNNGLMNANDTRPDDNITRAEMAVMIKKYIDTRCILADKAELSFKDKNVLTGELGEAVQVCVAAGIISGYDDNTFKPANLSTRAQVAAVFSRLDSFLAKAKPDVDALVRSKKAIVLEGEELNKVLLVMSANANKELYDDNGVSCVRFVPTTKAGTVQINVYQRRIEGADFFKLGAMRIRYKLINGEKRFDIGLIANMQQWLDANGPYRPENIEGEWVDAITEYANFVGNASSILPNESRDDYAYTFKPWGNGRSDIPVDSYFEIEKIGFFSDAETAANVEF